MTARFFDIATMRYNRRHCRRAMGKLYICLESATMTHLVPLDSFRRK